MDISEHYVFTGSKVGDFVTLINKSNGEVVWHYPIDIVPDRVLISPDESFFYISISSGAPTMGTAFFDKAGNVKFILHGGNSAIISNDGKYLVLSERLDKGLGNDVGVPIIKLINNEGQSLWSTVMNNDLTANHPAHQSYSWISEDKKEMIISNFQYVYFFEGGIEKMNNKETNQTIKDIQPNQDKFDEMQNKTFWQKIIDWLTNLFKIFQ